MADTRIFKVGAGIAQSGQNLASSKSRDLRLQFIYLPLICLSCVVLPLGFSGQVKAEEPCIKSAELTKKALSIGSGSDEEISLYKEAQTLCPKMAEAHFNLGLAYQKRGDLTEAEKELRESVRLKDEEQFRLGLAGVLLQQGEVSSSREQYQIVKERNPQSVAALQGSAVILEKQQKLQEALEELEKAAKIEPTNTVTFFNLGVLQEKLKRPDQALIAYQHSVQNDPKNFEAQYLLGLVQLRKGLFAESKESLQQASQIKPGDVRVHLGLAEVYENLGDRGMAEASLRRVVATAPSNVVALINLGIILIEDKRYQDAVRVLEKAGEVDRKNPRVWSALGRAQLELGLMKEAERNLKLALELDNSNPFAHNNLGVLYQRLGRAALARSEFEAALTIHPELEVARKNLESVGGSAG